MTPMRFARTRHEPMIFGHLVPQRDSRQTEHLWHAIEPVVDCQETSAACGIQCMPTFQFYKGGKKVDEMSGADSAKLKALIEKNK